MNFDELLGHISPEVCEKLKRAVETGRWPNGEKLSDQQRENCLQAVIAYEHTHLPEEQRTGFIPPKSHDHCGGSGEVEESSDQPLKWH